MNIGSGVSLGKYEWRRPVKLKIYKIVGMKVSFYSLQIPDPVSVIKIVVLDVYYCLQTKNDHQDFCLWIEKWPHKNIVL